MTANEIKMKDLAAARWAEVHDHPSWTKTAVYDDGTHDGPADLGRLINAADKADEAFYAARSAAESVDRDQLRSQAEEAVKCLLLCETEEDVQDVMDYLPLVGIVIVRHNDLVRCDESNNMIMGNHDHVVQAVMAGHSITVALKPWACFSADVSPFAGGSHTKWTDHDFRG